MATRLRGLDLLPLWRRRIPRYPVYWHGDPQLQVVLPHFWMKLVKPSRDIPSDQARFIVHPQMSKIDVKNYLEKIYKVPVLNVRTKVMADVFTRGSQMKQWTPGKYKPGIHYVSFDCPFKFIKSPRGGRIEIYQAGILLMSGDIKHPSRGHVMAKEDDYKVAFVQLGDGMTFEFPEIFKDVKSPVEKQVAEVKQQNREEMEKEQKYWDKLSVPVWFR